jgi:heme-degrading monooxygenase HmoA
VTQPRYHLAQVNVARMLAPLEDDLMADFVARLDEINAIADGVPGFVWRLQTEAGNATYLRPYDDDRILFNMSVWQSLDALRAYVYSSDHTEVMRQRLRWFERPDQLHLALWWVEAGHIPTIDEAKAKLALLQQHGPTAEAFTFKQPFPPPVAVRQR